MKKKILFHGISWPVQYGLIRNQHELDERLEEEDIDLNDFNFEPNLNSIQIICEYLDGEDVEHFIQVDLIPENNTSFRATELLLKIHNALIEHLENNDYHFLEGLMHIKGEQYEVLLGN